MEVAKVIDGQVLAVGHYREISDLTQPPTDEQLADQNVLVGWPDRCGVPDRCWYRDDVCVRQSVCRLIPEFSSCRGFAPEPVYLRRKKP